MDDGVGLAIMFIVIAGALGFFGGCSTGYSMAKENAFSKKEVCYEAHVDGATWKTCYALVKKSEVTPDKPESR